MKCFEFDADHAEDGIRIHVEDDIPFVQLLSDERIPLSPSFLGAFQVLGAKVNKENNLLYQGDKLLRIREAGYAEGQILLPDNNDRIALMVLVTCSHEGKVFLQSTKFEEHIENDEVKRRYKPLQEAVGVDLLHEEIEKGGEIVACMLRMLPNSSFRIFRSGDLPEHLLGIRTQNVYWNGEYMKVSGRRYRNKRREHRAQA